MSSCLADVECLDITPPGGPSQVEQPVNKEQADIQRMFINMNMDERKSRLEKMVHIDPQTKRWICRICSVSFTRKNATTDHIEGHHIRILSYPCFYCESQFTCASQRRTHIHSNHREQNKMAKFLTD